MIGNRSEPFEKFVAKGNLIYLQTDCKVLHEVRVYDKSGKIKKLVSEDELHKRHWEIAKEESRNKRFQLAKPQKKGKKNARTRKIQEPLTTEQFEDEEFY